MVRPSRYTDEFKADAVALVVWSGRSINDVARELRLCHDTLRGWVRGRKPRPRPAASDRAGLSLADKDAEIARLRARVAELQIEKEILRKAAACFAKEDGSVTSRFRFISTHRGLYGVKRVERLMRAHLILGRHLRRRVRTTIAGHAPVPATDLLRRDFHAETVDQALVR